MHRTQATAAILAIFLLATSAGAGQFVVIPHTIDSSEVGVDTIPPAKPTLTVKEIRRGIGPREKNGSWWSSSVDDMASINCVPVCNDDRSKPFEIGYRFTLVGGTLPDGFRLPDEPRRPLGCGGIGKFKDCLLELGWLDGAIDYQEPFDFTFTVVAIDKAGNESETSDPVHVVHPGVAAKPR